MLLQGHLLRQGIKVPCHALRNAIHRVDHISTVTRKRSVVRRCIYSVPHPNYIWHVDGHHKLIRWCFVIRGDFHAQSPTSSVQTTIRQQQYLICSARQFQVLVYLVMFVWTVEGRM